MTDRRYVSERSQSVINKTSQAAETTGSRLAGHRSGTSSADAVSVDSRAGLTDDSSMTTVLSLDSLLRPVHVAGAGVADVRTTASSSSSSSVAKASRGLVRVLKSPEGSGADIRAIFADKNMRVMKGAVVHEIQSIQNYLRQACDDARRIVTSAADEVQNAKDTAREQGRVEAFAEVVGELERARREYDRLMSGAEADMIELAFQIARQIIGHSIEVNPTVLRDIVAKSLVHVRGKRQIVVIVHPDDLEMVETYRDALAQEVEGAALYFGADSKVERGGCVIETESGRLDARLGVQLNILKSVLLKGGK